MYDKVKVGYVSRNLNAENLNNSSIKDKSQLTRFDKCSSYEHFSLSVLN